MNVQFKLVTAMATALILAACSTPVEQPDRTGFISDYSRLTPEKDEAIEMTEDEAMSYIGDKVGSYGVFMVDDVTLLFKPEPGKDKFSREELDELLQFAHDKMVEALTKDGGYEVVTEPGQGVARMRLAITDVDATIGALNLSSATKLTGAGLGGAAVEGELVDSMTGEQLAATIRWGGGSRYARSGYTKMGDAKIILERWAKMLRKHIDEAHGVED